MGIRAIAIEDDEAVARLIAQVLTSHGFEVCGTAATGEDGVALARALKEGWIAGAGLDVMEREPPDPDDPLLKQDNVVLTPHYASYTEEAYAEMRRKVVEGVAAALRGEFPRVVVNPEVRATARLLRLRSSR